MLEQDHFNIDDYPNYWEQTKDLMSFENAVAAEHGVPAAIFIQVMKQKLEDHEALNLPFRDGRYWVCGVSRVLCSEDLTFFSISQLYRVIRKLVKAKAIMVRSDNESKFDRSRWISLV